MASESPGLFDALRRVAGTALAIGQSRLELASIEVAEAWERLLAALLIGLFGVLLSTLALAGLSAWSVVLLWERFGPATLLVLALLYMLAGASLLAWMRRRLRSQPALLEATIGELRRDALALGARSEPAAGADAQRGPP